MGTLAKLPEPQMSAWISAAFMRLSQSASVHESAPGVEAKCSHHRTVASGHSMPSGNCGCVIVVLANWITSNQCLGAAGATRASGTGGTREIKLALHVSRTHDNHLPRENQEPEEREPPREKALRIRPTTLRTALPAIWNRLRTIHLLPVTMWTRKIGSYRFQPALRYLSHSSLNRLLNARSRRAWAFFHD